MEKREKDNQNLPNSAHRAADSLKFEKTLKAYFSILFATFSSAPMIIVNLAVKLEYSSLNLKFRDPNHEDRLISYLSRIFGMMIKVGEKR